MFVLVCIGLLLWLFIYLCISHVSEIIWYLSFSIWFISLSMILSRSIHVVTNGKTSCFFYDLVVFQSTYTLHLPYPFIHLSELSFHSSAVVNNTAVHLVGYVSFGHSDGKESACNAGHPGSIPGSGRFPGERNGKPPQYSCLENSVDRGAWSGIAYGVAKSQTQLTSTHISFQISVFVFFDKYPNLKSWIIWSSY